MMSCDSWSKFFWKDWESDPALKLCGLAAQGLWMRLLCIASASTVKGHVRIGRKPATLDQISQIVGSTPATVSKLISELEANGVFDRSKDGAIVSRRMVRDAKKYANDRQNGKAGGRPKPLSDKEETDNPPLLKNQNPPENPRARARAVSVSVSVSKKGKGVQGEREGDPRLPTEQPWEQRCAGWVAKGFWLPQWGPKPDEQGCLAPFDLVAEAVRRRRGDARPALRVVGEA